MTVVVGIMIETLYLFLVSRAANVLSGAGEVQRGDRVMVILPRLPEWWLLNIACLRTGNDTITHTEVNPCGGTELCFLIVRWKSG